MKKIEHFVRSKGSAATLFEFWQASRITSYYLLIKDLGISLVVSDPALGRSVSRVRNGTMGYISTCFWPIFLLFLCAVLDQTIFLSEQISIFLKSFLSVQSLDLAAVPLFLCSIWSFCCCRGNSWSCCCCCRSHFFLVVAFIVSKLLVFYSV